MRYSSKAIFAALALSLFMFAYHGIYGQEQVQAVLRELAGTVEIKRSNSEVWETGSRGQILGWDSTISTGFRSTAVIAMGDSLVTLRPLTRISIYELSQNQGNEKIELNLQTGRVRADVRAPEGGKTEFVVRSPNATNSVRGTIFEFDTLQLTVLQGTVEITGVSGATRIFDAGSGMPLLVDAGGFSRLDEFTGRLSYPPDEAAAELRPSLPIGAEPIHVKADPPSQTTYQDPPKDSPSDSPNLGGPTPGPGLVDFGPDIVF